MDYTSDKLNALIHIAVKREVEHWTELIVRFAQHDYKEFDLEHKGNVGKTPIISSEMIQETKECITSLIYTTGMMALIAEYGKGSKMDKENPNLSDYMSSDYYNKVRNNYKNAVMSRPEQTYYYDLDDVRHEIRYSKNVINLESPRKKKNGELGESFTDPIPPRFLLRSLVDSLANAILNDVADSIIDIVPFEMLFQDMEIKITL